MAPTCPSSAYPGDESALGLPAPVGSPPGGAGLRAGEGRSSGRRGRSGAGAGRVGAGRAGARSRRAGPVSAAPCPQRGRREAQDARWPGRGSAAFPAAAAPAWAALGSRSWAGGGAQAEGGGERPDRREGQGKLSARRRAAPVAKPPLPAPARWCTSLSFSLAHSLTSWLEIPTDVEREDRQTDTRAHAAGAGGGVAAGGGESPHFWGRRAPPALPCRRAWLPPLGAAMGRRTRGARSAARTPGFPAELPQPALPKPQRPERTGTPPWKRLRARIVPGGRRRGGGGCAAVGVWRSRALRTGPSIWRG